MRNQFLILAALLTPAVAAWGQTSFDERPFGIGLETGGVSFSRNDIRIPNDTGTRFDMTELTGSGPDFFVRLDGHWDINDRHGLRLVLAPLEVSGTGDLPGQTSFAGETFAAGATQGTYKFNTYKITYRYTFVDRPESAVAGRFHRRDSRCQRRVAPRKPPGQRRQRRLRACAAPVGRLPTGRAMDAALRLRRPRRRTRPTVRRRPEARLRAQ